MLLRRGVPGGSTKATGPRTSGDLKRGEVQVILKSVSACRSQRFLKSAGDPPWVLLATLGSAADARLL